MHIRELLSPVTPSRSFECVGCFGGPPPPLALPPLPDMAPFVYVRRGAFAMRRLRTRVLESAVPAWGHEIAAIALAMPWSLSVLVLATAVTSGTEVPSVLSRRQLSL